MYNRIKSKVHSLLHPEIGDTHLDKFINTLIIILIILNVIAVTLETVSSIYEPNKKFFRIFDLVSVIIFSIEYVFRVWSSNHDPRYKHSLHGRLRYIFSIEALIDLLAILPFYINVFVGFDLRVLRILRLFRFLRLFRLTAYMKSAQMVRNVFKSRANDLFLSLVLALSLIVISSCLIYFAEHNAQPAIFTSIPATFWWAIVTITTVGYGDMIPITLIGKILTALITLFGIVILALPAGIITAGFLAEIKKVKKIKYHVCPHCGKPLDQYEKNRDTDLS